MYESVRKGEIMELKKVGTIADGIAVKKPGELTFNLCRKYVDDIVTVSDSEIASAILSLLENQKTVAEGAGAASIAAVMFGKVDTENKNTVCVISGGNIDVTLLSRVITRGLTKTGRLTELTTKVVDQPGHLIEMLQIISRSGANVISVDHKRENKNSGVNECVISIVLETRNLEHVEEIKASLKNAGYDIPDY